jgi:hypothetical protein
MDTFRPRSITGIQLAALPKAFSGWVFTLGPGLHQRHRHRGDRPIRRTPAPWADMPSPTGRVEPAAVAHIVKNPKCTVP